jgi:hypothetical protein
MLKLSVIGVCTLTNLLWSIRKHGIENQMSTNLVMIMGSAW